MLLFYLAQYYVTLKAHRYYRLIYDGKSVFLDNEIIATLGANELAYDGGELRELHLSFECKI